MKTLRSNVDGNARAVTAFNSEIEVLRTLSSGCPSIIQYLGDGFSVDTQGRKSRFLALEYASFPLSQRLSSSDGKKTSGEQAVKWGIDIARALAYLHAQVPL